MGPFAILKNQKFLMYHSQCSSCRQKVFLINFYETKFKSLYIEYFMETLINVDSLIYGSFLKEVWHDFFVF